VIVRVRGGREKGEKEGVCLGFDSEREEGRTREKKRENQT
jgi:hypothetical protein